MQVCLDYPKDGETCDPLGFRVEGWLFERETEHDFSRIEVWVGTECVGATEEIFIRPDVNAAHGLPISTRTGFAIFAHAPDGPFGAEIMVSLRGRRGRETIDLLQRPARFIARDYRSIPHGKLLAAEASRPWRRDDIFGSGPSQAIGSEEILALIHRYIGSAPQRILDVGCGLGWYGKQLLAAGHSWHGVEVKPSDLAALADAGLPHTAADGKRLPFSDAAFGLAMAIEVLEHIDEPRAFLAELRRVCPRRLVVSVPNCELVTYLLPHMAVPWHMLEADHKNFFTRWNLAALLREFYPQVEVIEHTPFPWRTVEGSMLFNNLFAIAST